MRLEMFEANWAMCPEPSCLDKRQMHGARGPVLTCDAMGEPSIVAVPCNRHTDFDYVPDWYLRWAAAATEVAEVHSSLGYVVRTLKGA